MNITQHSEPTDPTSPSRPAAAHDQSHTLDSTVGSHTRHPPRARGDVPRSFKAAGVGDTKSDGYPPAPGCIQ